MDAKVRDDLLEMAVKNSRKTVNIEELVEDALLIEDLDYDSIDFMEFIIQIEQKYDIEFGGTDILLSNLNSVNIMSEYVQRKLQEKRNG